MKKRLFSFLLALCMIVSVFPVTAWAAETDGETVALSDTDSVETASVEEEEFEEEEEEEPQYPLSGRCGDYTNWELDENGNLTVTGEGKIKGGNYEEAAPWYEYRKEITSVTLSEEITYIGHNAFRGCVNLKEVDMPIQLKKIGDAFIGCTGLEKITFYGDAPEFIMQITDYRMLEDTVVTVYYPSDNATWTDEVMRDYGGSTSWESYDRDGVVLASGSCGSGATWKLTGGGLLSISGSGDMTDYGTWRDVPWGAYREVIKEVIIAEGITSIGDSAFNSCTVMNDIYIPSTVTKIGRLSLTGCNSLRTVDIPPDVTVIGEGAFGSCSGLTEITLPGALEEIGNMAFWGIGITELLVPDSVKKIGEMAFGCEELKKITFLGDAPNMMEGAFSGVTAKAYYPVGNATWTEEVLNKDYAYDGKITWSAYCPGGHYYEDGVCIKCGTAKISAPAVKASNIASSGKIRLTWKAVEDAEKYVIYYAGSKSGVYRKLTTVTSTEFVHADTAAGVTNYYYVVSVAENGEISEKSNIVGRTCDLEQPVVSLSNVASTGKVRISWTAVEGAVKYQVYVSTSKNGTYKRISTTAKTAITNTSAEPGVTYYYKVKAIANKTAGNSAYSAVKARTCDLARPDVTVGNVASTGKVRISWTAVEGAVKYQVYVSTSKNGTYKRISTTAKTAITNTSAEAGVKYYYKVKAIAAKSAANSVYSEVKYRVCDLPQPEIRVVWTSSDKPRVTWEAVPGAVEYQVYRANSLNGTYSRMYITSETRYTNSGATPGKVYYYKVKAVAENVNANSAFSESKRPSDPLSRPKVSVTLTSKGKPRVTWNSVKGAEKYEVYRATSPDGTYSLMFTTTGTGYTNSSAKAGTTYYYKVKAIGKPGGDASVSNPVFISCSSVGFSGSKSARDLIDHINTYRKSIGLGKLKWYEAGLDAAKIRAAELNKLPSAEERPGGADPEDMWDDYGVAIELCLVTGDGATAQDLADALMQDEDLYDFGLVCLLDVWSGAVAARNGDYWVIMFTE